VLASCGEDDGQPSGGTAEPEPSAEDGLVELLFVQKSAGVSFEATPEARISPLYGQ
jgi:hypothetical protein